MSHFDKKDLIIQTLVLFTDFQIAMRPELNAKLTQVIEKELHGPLSSTADLSHLALCAANLTPEVSSHILTTFSKKPDAAHVDRERFAIAFPSEISLSPDAADSHMAEASKNSNLSDLL